MNGREIAVTFSCASERLYGVVHHPAEGSGRGLVLLPGRPALRSGRHRLFVMLARAWAQTGIPVMRFDYRGAGDCEGEMGTLEESSADISSAIDVFQSQVATLQEVVLWGLCGGAADAVLYASRDPRVIGLALVNPWFYDTRVRTLVSLHRRGTAFLENVQRWTGSLGRATRVSTAAGEEPAGDAGEQLLSVGRDASLPPSMAAVDRAYNSYRVPGLSARLARELQNFRGRTLLILSGQDPGAQAFKRMASISLKWRRLLADPRVTVHDLPEANHSLRRREWREQAAAWTMLWMGQIDGAPARR